VHDLGVAVGSTLILEIADPPIKSEVLGHQLVGAEADTGTARLAAMGIDHVDLVVSDLDRGLEFYRGLLGPLGYVREGTIRGERGEPVVYLNRVDGAGSVSVRERQVETPHERYAVGLHHLAFLARSRAVVDERARWIAAQGATIESGPKEYDYTPGYYAVFFHDPDGIKLEILHRPSAQDIAARLADLASRVAALEKRG
jgi:glyoxylase I family protein